MEEFARPASFGDPVTASGAEPISGEVADLVAESAEPVSGEVAEPNVADDNATLDGLEEEPERITPEFFLLDFDQFLTDLAKFASTQDRPAKVEVRLLKAIAAKVQSRIERL